MTRLSPRSRRWFASLLAGVWLLVSNAMLCLLLPAPASAGASHAHALPLPDATEDPHAGHHAGSMHTMPADALTPEPEPHGCCAQTVMPPCCADAGVAPGFGVTWTAPLALAPPPEPMPELRHAASPIPPKAPDRPPDARGPPTYLRCCSLLI